MKILQATTFVTLMLGSLASHAAPPIINITVGGEISPGVYGEVQFGNAPPPPVLYAAPRIIVHQPHDDEFEPIYLHVPPGHARNWARHCRKYDACDRPVYFVRSAEYEPGYRSRKDRRHWEEERMHQGRSYGRRDDVRGDEERSDEHGYIRRGDEGRSDEHRDEGHRD